MTIGQLASRTGLSVRRLRFYADAGVLPEAGRTNAGYRRFEPDAVPRARLIRTLRAVARHWTLVGIVNDWPQARTPAADELIDAWEWYARALRALA